MPWRRKVRQRQLYDNRRPPTRREVSKFCWLLLVRWEAKMLANLGGAVQQLVRSTLSNSEPVRYTVHQSLRDQPVFDLLSVS